MVDLLPVEDAQLDGAALGEFSGDLFETSRLAHELIFLPRRKIGFNHGFNVIAM